MNPINVKLGQKVNRGFYNNDTSKEYTQIIENKVAYNLLSVLSKDTMRINLGVYHQVVHNEIHELQPDLSWKDQEVKTLNSLLHDFVEGGLVDASYRKGLGNIKITPLGIQFLKNNVILKEIND